MDNLAPIVLFVYNRPNHTRQTLEALAKNDLADQSILYIYADGPKEGASEEALDNIKVTRAVLREKQWCKEIQIIESKINRGLADSIVTGVSEVVNRHDKVIVLEDDIVTSLGFLKYMNDALNLYANEELVMHVSGYMYPVNSSFEDGTCFLKMLSCWGWGTWSRAWKNYSDDLDFFVKSLDTPQKIADFNIGGSASFYDQLYDNYMLRLKTWAVRWYASWYFNGGYSIFPKTTMVLNIGHDGSGINCGQNSFYESPLVATRITIDLNSDIKEDLEYKKKLSDFFVEEKRVFSESYNEISISTIGKIKWKLDEFVSKIINSLLFRYNLFYGSNSLLNKQKQDFYGSVLGNNALINLPYSINASAIGDYTYIAENANIKHAVIGKFCSVGPNLVCGYGIHPLNGISTAPMFYSIMKQNGMTLSTSNKIIEQKPIKIGNDVFIGMNVSILDGVTIGDGAVIGAGTVVSKDVPPYTVAVGTPVQFIKKRFTDEQIEALLRIKWWNFPVEQLHDVESMFFDLDSFIKKYDKVN